MKRSNFKLYIINVDQTINQSRIFKVALWWWHTVKKPIRAHHSSHAHASLLYGI